MDKLWLDLDGNLIPVGDDLSHEEWANDHGVELEALLDAGWLRVQSLPPKYLLIDFRLRLNALQAKAVERLFEDRYEQVLAEFGRAARSFVEGGEALAWVLGRE
jgi:hypothetical protein